MEGLSLVRDRKERLTLSSRHASVNGECSSLEAFVREPRSHITRL